MPLVRGNLTVDANERVAVGVGGAFLFFSGVSATHFAFTFRYLPETKGKSLEEIEASLGSGASGGGAYARLDEADER